MKKILNYTFIALLVLTLVLFAIYYIIFSIEEEKDFAILTSEITKATFNMTPSEYKEFKGLNKENLRDHMDDMEIILTMLGETTTTRFTRDRNSKEFPKLKQDAKDGGDVAGDTRKCVGHALQGKANGTPGRNRGAICCS